MPSLIISVIIITCEIPWLVKLSLTGKIIHFPHMVTHVTHYRIMNFKQRSPEVSRWKIFAGEDLITRTMCLSMRYIRRILHKLSVCTLSNGGNRWTWHTILPAIQMTLLHLVPQGLDMLFAAPTFLKSACSFAALYRPSKTGGIFTMTFTISAFDLVK